jgi:tetratricopeptide (TPR) repeat protein
MGLESLRKEPGSDKEELFNGLMMLGKILWELARLSEAEGAFREAIDIERTWGAASTRSLASDLSFLGCLLNARERYEEALPLLEEDVELWVAAVGRQDSEYAQSLMNLGGCLEGLDQATEAEELYREGLGIFRRRAGAADR